MNTEETYCCAGLKFAISNVGVGISVIARNPFITLPVSLGSFTRWKLRGNHRHEVLPICGKEIDDLIRSNTNYFIQLAQKHTAVLPETF
jgi:hypothetical protein